MPKTNLQKDPKSGLYLPAAMFVKKFYDRERVGTLPSGERARKWHPEGAQNVVQTETDDRLDAVVKPKVVGFKLKLKGN